MTGNTKKDQKHPGGVFLVSLADRIKSDIQIKEIPLAIRHLQANRTPEMNAALKKTTDEVRNAYFPGDKEFVEDFAKGRFENKAPSSYDHFFCSELLSYSLMSMGVLDRNAHIPIHYNPKSYLTENKKGVPLLDGATLGPEICIDRIS